jgi:hypothetical protein
MIIDTGTFANLAVHLQLASEALVTLLQHINTYSEQAFDRGQATMTFEALYRVGTQLGLMDGLLQAVGEANAQECGAGDRDVPLLGTGVPPDPSRAQ